MGHRVVPVAIPDIETLSDEELATLARGLDGRWSEQTKALLRAFDTERLDLNIWWASTWQGWGCPCCNRDKTNIARLGPNGVLLCRLEVHHDHLADYARKVFDVANPKVDGEGALNHQIANAKDGLVVLVERFERALVCGDCNAAEGVAKARLHGQIDHHFSFTPTEIAKFIRTAPNRVHEVDLSEALRSWQTAKDDFADRIDFARRMAARFSAGKHRREALHRMAAVPFDDHHFVWRQITEAMPHLEDRRLSSVLEGRSISNDGAGQSTRPKRPKPKPVPPTDAEYATIVETMPQGRRTWDEAGEDWQCECCRRSKREICRRSNKGTWAAQIHRVRTWVMETDTTALEYRKDDATGQLVIGSHRPALICHDCKNIVTKVQQRASGTLNSYCLAVGDLTAVITSVAPNREHEVDFDEAMRRAESNRPLMEAARDFDRHRRAVGRAAVEFEHLTRFGHYSRAGALANLVDRHLAKNSVEREAAEARLEWMLAEAFRFNRLEESED